MFGWLLAVLALVAAPAAVDYGSTAACEPAADDSVRSGPELRPGRYRLILVATEGSRRGQSTSGTLRLAATTASDRSPRTGEVAVADDLRRAPLFGSTDVDFAAVGAPVFEAKAPGMWPSPRSEDPVYPGVLVLAGQQPVDSGRASATILVATLQNRRDGRFGLDGTGIGLWVRAGRNGLLQGSWSEWGVIADGRGHFCLERID